MLYFQSHLLVQHIKLLLFYLKHEEVKILENLWSVFAKTRVVNFCPNWGTLLTTFLSET